jgi:tetrahedral aminopeptidase
MLQQLSTAIGISGKEDAVRQLVLDAIRGHVQDTRIDPIGSVITRKPALDGAVRPLRVMVAAHMDEVGLMVKGFDSDGLIRFTNVGGIDDRILPGLRVRINEVIGVVLWTPIHYSSDQNVVKMSSLRIDIGASSKDEAMGKVKRGDRIAFESEFLELDDGRMLRGKALDDRAGCALLIDVLQREGGYPHEVIGAFTVQEEIGLRGAMVAAQTIQPDIAFVLEATTANDLPNPTASRDSTLSVNPTCVMGQGPVLSWIDASMIVPPRLLAFLRETAEAEGIPYQFKSNPGGGTDGGQIHLANEGVPTAVISLPCRYIHSPAAYLLREDYANALRLIQAALTRLTPQLIEGAS